MMPKTSTTSLFAIAIKSIPRTHLRKYENQESQSISGNVENPFKRYERVLSALTQLEITIGFRVQTTNGYSKAMFLTGNDSRYSESLRAILSANFPDFEFEIIEASIEMQIKEPVSVAVVTGVPKLSPSALDQVAKIMSNYQHQSLFQIWSYPSKPSRKGRFFAKKRYERALSRSQQQEVSEGLFGKQDTRTKFDAEALEVSKKHESAFRRMRASRGAKCRVMLAFWGGQDAEVQLQNAVASLLAVLSEQSKQDQLEVKYLKDKKALDALNDAAKLGTRTRSTFLLPSEATPYFQIPSIDIGIPVKSPSTFVSGKTKPVTEEYSKDQEIIDEIFLGKAFRQSDVFLGGIETLPLHLLRKHIAILGASGSGKSTTKNRIIIDAWKKGIPSLSLEIVKADARILCGAIPEMRIFTAGDEMTTPYRDNPFHIPEGVRVATHIGMLHTCFMAAWPVYGMLANHLRRCLVQTYVNNGWDPVTNKRGYPITLETFREEAEKYCTEHIEYGSELSQDFRGAIIARAEDLCDPNPAMIFNTTTNLSMEELLSKPTIIEFQHVGEPDFVAFLVSLLLIRIYEHLITLGPADKLRFLLVIDEAHRILEELPKTLDMSEHAVARRHAIDQLVNLLAEARSYGLGVIIADQNPARLARDALKNCSTRILHRMIGAEDLELMGKEVGCTPPQIEHLSVMEDGEAVIRSPQSHVPTKMKVHYDPDFYPEMNRYWTDDDIRERMREFYQNHPEYAKRPEIPVFVPQPTNDDPEKIIQTQTFEDLYYDALDNAKENPDDFPVERVFVHFALEVTPSGGDIEGTALQLLEIASEVHGPPPDPVNIPFIHSLIAESIQQEGFRRRHRAS